MKLISLTVCMLLLQTGCIDLHAQQDSAKQFAMSARSSDKTELRYMRITQPAALAYILETDLVPWVSLWDPATTPVALAYPNQTFFADWLDMLACLKMAEWAGGEHIVICAKIGPSYGQMPIWNCAHYQAVYDRALKQKALLEKSWGLVELAIDTELIGGLADEQFPVDFCTDVSRYRYYKPVYFDRRHPHTGWQYMLGPGEIARQVAPVYHRDWNCPPGYLKQKYWGEIYDHTDLDEFLAYKNCLLSALPDDEVSLCREIREAFRR